MVGLAPSRDAEICLGGDLGSFLIEAGPFHTVCLMVLKRTVWFELSVQTPTHLMYLVHNF